MIFRRNLNPISGSLQQLNHVSLPSACQTFLINSIWFQRGIGPMEFDYDSDKLMNIFVFLVPIGDV